MYTTGELAKKCNVSVRTVQYYDERGILIPSELTEGGRRMYSENSVVTLETICFLRNIGLSIKDIASVLTSEESKDVVNLLLSQQIESLENEITENEKKLSSAKQIQKIINSYEYNDASEETLHDAFKIVNGKNELYSMYKKMFVPSVILILLEVKDKTKTEMQDEKNGKKAKNK